MALCLEDLAKLIIVLTEAPADVEFNLVNALVELAKRAGGARPTFV